MTTDTYPTLQDPPPPLPTPRRALAIGAHPDDIEFGCGGTLAKWAADGCDVTMLVVTDGSKGSWDPDTDPAELATRRKEEQQCAARALGAARVVHLDHVDGELQYTMELRAELCRQIRLHRPDVLLSHDPWLPYELHPDHRATGTAAVDGMVAARDHLFFPDQGLPAHRPDAMLLFRPGTADHFEDVAATFDAKLSALLCHASQGTTTMGGAHDDAERQARFVAKLREWMRKAGEPVGIELAETFKRLTP